MRGDVLLVIDFNLSFSKRMDPSLRETVLKMRFPELIRVAKSLGLHVRGSKKSLRKAILALHSRAVEQEELITDHRDDSDGATAPLIDPNVQVAISERVAFNRNCYRDNNREDEIILDHRSPKCDDPAFITSLEKLVHFDGVELAQIYNYMIGRSPVTPNSFRERVELIFYMLKWQNGELYRRMEEGELPRRDLPPSPCRQRVDDLCKRALKIRERIQCLLIMSERARTKIYDRIRIAENTEPKGHLSTTSITQYILYSENPDLTKETIDRLVERELDRLLVSPYTLERLLDMEWNELSTAAEKLGIFDASWASLMIAKILKLECIPTIYDILDDRLEGRAAEKERIKIERKEAEHPIAEMIGRNAIRMLAQLSLKELRETLGVNEDPKGVTLKREELITHILMEQRPPITILPEEVLKIIEAGFEGEMNAIAYSCGTNARVDPRKCDLISTVRLALTDLQEMKLQERFSRIDRYERTPCPITLAIHIETYSVTVECGKVYTVLDEILSLPRNEGEIFMEKILDSLGLSKFRGDYHVKLQFIWWLAIAKDAKLNSWSTDICRLDEPELLALIPKEYTGPLDRCSLLWSICTRIKAHNSDVISRKSYTEALKLSPREALALSRYLYNGYNRYRNMRDYIATIDHDSNRFEPVLPEPYRHIAAMRELRPSPLERWVLEISRDRGNFEKVVEGFGLMLIPDLPEDESVEYLLDNIHRYRHVASRLEERRGYTYRNGVVSVSTHHRRSEAASITLEELFRDFHHLSFREAVIVLESRCDFELKRVFDLIGVITGSEPRWTGRGLAITAISSMITYSTSIWHFGNERQFIINTSYNPILMSERTFGDLADPIISYGTLFRYKSYQLSELIDSVVMDENGQFRLHNPSYDGHIDIERDFPMLSLYQLCALLEIGSKRSLRKASEAVSRPSDGAVSSPTPLREMSEAVSRPSDGAVSSPIRDTKKSVMNTFQRLIALVNNCIHSNGRIEGYTRKRKLTFKTLSLAERVAIEEIAVALFLSGMTARFWKGPGADFPHIWIENGAGTQANVDESGYDHPFLSSIEMRDANFTACGIRIRERLSSLPSNALEYINDLRIIEHEFHTRNSYLTDKRFMEIFELASKQIDEGFCLADYADRAIQTWCHFMIDVLEWNEEAINTRIRTYLECSTQPEFEAQSMGIANHIDPDFGKRIKKVE